MSSPNTAVCARLKTAIAEEVGNIQAMSEKFIAESNDYLINRIPQGTFDNRQGVEPRKVRYMTAPVKDTKYVDISVSGNQDGTMPTRENCTGGGEDHDAVIDKRGAFGCNLPGETISAGYDEFFRRLKGKAWQTEPFCAMDLFLKKHYNEYIDMLQRDLPKRAREQFQYDLERNVVAFAKYNTSVVAGFTFSEGVYPAVPAGTLDVNTIRRVFAILGAQGWDDTMPEIGPISAEAFETMRRNYKADEGLDINSTLDSGETRFIENGLQKVDWAGYRWVITPRPTRGYLLPLVGGGFEFVRVNPTKVREGTGEGIVTDVNEDYFNCRTVCEGNEFELYEVAYYIHPTAATREAFAMPQVGNQSFSNNAFNFEVMMIDGAFLDCNEDNLKGKFRLKHAYAFESTEPEMMGSIIYRVSPDCVKVHAPCCDEQCPPPAGNEVEMADPDNPSDDNCSAADCDPASCDDEPDNMIDPLPEEDAPCPDGDEGIIKLSTCGPIITETDNGEVCVWVERAGGSLGAASVDYTTADGTAAQPGDYTTTADTLNWADGENDRKKVCVPINPAGAGGVAFDFNLSGVVGAALADDATTGCSTTEIQIEEPCDPAP